MHFLLLLGSRNGCPGENWTVASCVLLSSALNTKASSTTVCANILMCASDKQRKKDTKLRNAIYCYEIIWPCKLDLHYFVWSLVVQMEMVTDQVQMGNGLCQDSSSCCQPWHFRACCPSLLNCLPGYSGACPAEQQSLAVISPWEWLAPECSVLWTPLEHYGVCFMGVMYFERIVWHFWCVLFD